MNMGMVSLCQIHFVRVPTNFRSFFSSIDLPDVTGLKEFIICGFCAYINHTTKLSDIFTDIYIISLSQAVVLTCVKAAIIIPVQKKSSTSCFNDYCPVACTPLLMSVFISSVENILRFISISKNTKNYIFLNIQIWLALPCNP